MILYLIIRYIVLLGRAKYSSLCSFWYLTVPSGGVFYIKILNNDKLAKQLFFASDEGIIWIIIFGNILVNICNKLDSIFFDVYFVIF